MSTRKVVVCGAGFLGSYVARELGRNPRNVVYLASRNPSKIHDKLKNEAPFAPGSETASHYPATESGTKSGASSSNGRLGTPLTIDITSSDINKSLVPAFEGAHTIVSLVGILHGSPEAFEKIQLNGNENVFKAAKSVGARVVHVSAVGANVSSSLPYFKTKAQAEQALFGYLPNATVLRPSILFGPGDGFFARFATLSKSLPFLPVFGGGTTKFSPVFAGDIARFISLCVDAEENGRVDAGDIQGKIFEAGGPSVFTYREMMELVLKYSNRTRPIMSLPWAVGKAQGFAMENIPENILTLTRDQVEQLKMDSVASSLALSGAEYAGSSPPPDSSFTQQDDTAFGHLLEKYSGKRVTSVHEVLPSYLSEHSQRTV